MLYKTEPLKYKVVITVWRLATEEEKKQWTNTSPIREMCSYNFLHPMTQDEVNTKLKEVSEKFNLSEGYYGVSFHSTPKKPTLGLSLRK